MSTERLSIQGTSARYEPLFKLASGGMATVYVGRLVGALGFQRLVAIKRPHRHLLEDPRLVKMLLDEATLASRLQHPNVVSVQDVVRVDDDVYLVMDLVEGASLSELMRTANERSLPIAPAVAVRMMLDTCAGLHAAHELADDDGAPLGLVHRDVSPHNVLVGVDGAARVSDFGIAKCVNVHGASTTTGTLKGKYGYMAPEHIGGKGLDRRADIFSLGVVAWELFAGRRLFLGESPPNTMMNVVHEPAPPLSSVTDLFDDALDDVLACALAKSPDERFATAEAFGVAMERAARAAAFVATSADVGRMVRGLVGESLDKRRKQVKALLEERSEHGDREERPTEPLPGPGGAPDSGLATPADELPGPLPVTASQVVTRDKQARPAVLPEVGTAAGSHDPTQMSASSPRPEPRASRGVTWAVIVAAIFLGGAITLGLQRLYATPAGSGVPAPTAAASSGLVASETNALPGVSTAAPPAEPASSAATASAGAGGSVAPRSSARPKPRTDESTGSEGAATSKGAGSGAPVSTAGEPAGTATKKSPPQNPYATP